MRRTRGFAMMWVLVMLAIVAALAAAAAPTLVNLVDRAEVEQTYATLAALDTGIIVFGQNVRRIGTVYPAFLHQLSTLPLLTEQTSCQNNPMNNNSQTTWTSSATVVGPYTWFLALPTGVITPIGVVTDLIPTRANGAAAFLINMPKVEQNLATMLDLLVDGAVSGVAGRILYGAASGTTPTVDVQYSVGLQPGLLLISQC